MKHIKTYEDISDNLQIGDYVVCLTDSEDIVKEFELCNIGQYIGPTRSSKYYIIKYTNIPTEVHNMIGGYTILASREEILHWSKNTKDLEIYIDANKYNL